MKTCPAAAFGCSCRRCPKPLPDPNKGLKRATYTTSALLILLAVVLGVFAFGLWNTEQVHKSIVAQRNV